MVARILGCDRGPMFCGRSKRRPYGEERDGSATTVAINDRRYGKNEELGMRNEELSAAAARTSRGAPLFAPHSSLLIPHSRAIP